MQLKTMRAIRQSMLGGPEVLELVSMPRPEPRATEVLVRVAAAGVNPVDWKTRSGYGGIGKPPFILGWDVAGTVEAVGSGVTRFAVGDRVFGMPEFPSEAGGYAQYVTARARHLAKMPERLGFVDAAAMPLSSLVAWQALVDTASVGPGDRILIQGAAGGVGHLAVQIAKSLGAYVLGTCAPRDVTFLHGLGVDEAIDFTQQDAASTVRDVDVVLDLVGGPVSMASLPVLRDGGLLISVPPFTDLVPIRTAAGDRIRVTDILVEPDRTGMEAIADLVEQDQLRVRVAHVFALEDAARAHELGETGAARGKIVLTAGAWARMPKIQSSVRHTIISTKCGAAAPQKETS
ncbi:NADP-dependent oxidoreductase [Streptomyces kronopolitis]|uniref:NADP-dependent oxidoreductase n=1 Tax=Streptomyces kronopolitis TaxID=1612435 RepID=UPI003673D292